MPRVDDRLARGLAAAAVPFILVAVAVAITGGVSIQLAESFFARTIRSGR